MLEPEAAVAVVHAAPPCDSVLLMRRAERASDSWSGHWSFPGGRRDPSDPSILHTALRELREECGVRLRPEDAECELPPRVAGQRAGAYVLVAQFVFRVRGELATILDPLEAAHAEWVPLRILRDPSRHYLRPVPGLPSEMLFPAIDLEGAPLWGFTWRVLVEWLQLGPRQPIAAVAHDLADSLGLACTWNRRTGQLRGPIPIDAVRARLSSPGPHVWSLQRAEVGPALIRLTAPDLEEYLIHPNTP